MSQPQTLTMSQPQLARRLVPRPGSKIWDMSPNTFLTYPKLHSCFQEAFSALDITDENMQQLSLYPKHEDSDESVADYSARMKSMSLDDELQLLLPAEEPFKKLGQKMDDLSKRLEATESEMRHLKGENLILYETNMMTQMLNEICKRRGVQRPEGRQNDASHTSPVKAVQHLNLNWLRPSWEIKRDHLKVLKREYLGRVSARNLMSHETQGPFARLLLSSDFKDTPICTFWRPVFLFCYNKTIEEVADLRPNTASYSVISLE